MCWHYTASSSKFSDHQWNGECNSNHHYHWYTGGLITLVPFIILNANSNTSNNHNITYCSSLYSTAIKFNIIIIGLQYVVELAPVTGRYLDIEPYNNLSLTCSATVTLRNVPAPLNIEFTWLRSVNSGPQEELTSDLYTNSRVFGYNETSTLTLLTEQPGNHTYTCRVNLNIQPAPDNTVKEQSVSLEVIGQFYIYRC